MNEPRQGWHLREVWFDDGEPTMHREPSKPEPVAFLANATRFKVTLTKSDCKITNLPRELGGRWVALVAAENDCHLKLTAPPQRPWQGLTDEEIDEKTDFRATVRYFEAKLKEKNT